MPFNTDDRVVIVATMSELDGTPGTVLGLAVDHIAKFWIVGLDVPSSIGGRLFRAVLMPGGCLQRLEPINAQVSR